jgi:PfaD family protein
MKSSYHQWWQGNQGLLGFGEAELHAALGRISLPVYLPEIEGRMGVTHEGTAIMGEKTPDTDCKGLLGMVPSLLPGQLGDRSFRQDHGLDYAYVVGAMANGITSVDMVQAAGKAGMIGFFGAGGLTPGQVETAIDRIQSENPACPYGFNLIHSPNDPQLEASIADLYLRRGVKRVSASAFLGLTLPLLYYRFKGIHQAPDGSVICPQRVIAKVSRIEVARKFFAPPPEAMLRQLVEQGRLSQQEARLAARMPVAQDMTAEADSGGHTDNRPAMALLPTFLALKDELQAQYGFKMPLRVGLGGGIATPAATAAAFAMGAAYVLTGSINQSCIEADTSEKVRQMLCQTRQADVTMAPAADMFELGAKVQVLKRGTMFAMRGAKLYDLYRTYDAYDDIPEKIRISVEKDILRASFEEAWAQTCGYFQQCDPDQIRRAESEPKHKMALVFRSYLGQASLWAKTGDDRRVIDYQIWCGPAMGSFNAWVKGSFLENPAERTTATIGRNLMYGAAVLTRAHWLRCQGVDAGNPAVVPLTDNEIQRRMSD